MARAFQKSAFQNNAFQVGIEEKIISGHGGGGGSTARRPYIMPKPLPEIIPEKEKEPELIKKDVEIILPETKLVLKVHDVQIQTTSNTEVQIQPIQLKISTNNIDIETTRNYYSQDEYLKLILILSEV